MLQKFILSLLVQAVQNPQVRAFALDLAMKLAAQLKDDLLPKLVALLPMFGAGLIKEVFDRAPDLPNIDDLDDVARGIATKILDSDPDLGPLSDIVDISEILRGYLNR